MSTEIDDELDIEPNELLEQEVPELEESVEPPKAEEDEKEAYSKRVQKRIDKITYERNVERQRREDIERKLAEQEARIQQLVEAQQARDTERESRNLEKQQQDLLTQRQEYLEIGDHAEVNKIDNQLIDLKLKTQQKPPEREVRREPIPTQPAPQAQLPDAMQAWYGRNEWVFDANQRAKLDKAEAIFQDLIKNGYNYEDDDIYEEVDRRLKRQSPPPGNGPDRGQVVGNGKTAFTAQDKRDMEAWGLNPNDANARKEWLRQKGQL